MTSKAKFILFLILLAGIILRYFKFSETIFLNTDQALTYIIADRVINEKFIPLNGGVISLPINILPPNYFYFLIVLYMISNNQHIISSLFSIMGVLSIILTYLLTKKIFKTRTALFTTLIFSFSYIFVRYSRYIWEAHTSPFFSLLSFYLLLLADQKKDIKYLYLSIFIYFIGFMYISPLLLFPSFLFLFITIAYRISKLKHIGLVTFFFLLALTIDLLPVIIFQYFHNFPVLEKLSEISRSNNDYFSFKVFSYLNALKDNFLVLVQTFFFTDNAQNLLIIVILIPIILFDFIKNRNRNYLLFVLLPFFTGMILTGFYQKAVYSYRLASLLPFFTIIFSISLLNIVNSFLKWKFKLKLSLSIITLMYVYQNINKVGMFINENKYSDLHPYRVGEYISQFLNKDNENISIFTIYNRVNGQTNYYGAEYWYALEKLRNQRYAKLDSDGNFLERKINPESNTIFLICRYFTMELEEKHCLAYFRKKEFLNYPVAFQKIDNVTVYVFKR